MILRFTQRALTDLDDIRLYIEERSPTGAQRVMATIDRVVIGLTEFPFKGRTTDEEDIRQLLAGRYPYLIYYRVSGEEVEIVHVRHAARRPWKSL